MTPQSILVMFGAVVATCMAVQNPLHYTQDVATQFVGAQHWWESGYSLDGGLKQHYDGFYCVCSCNATDEGIFCQGGEYTPTGTLDAKFMAAWSQSSESKWIGSVLSYEAPAQLQVSVSQDCPSCGGNYTGVSQGSSSSQPSVWRGYTSGVYCQFRTQCPMCASSPQYVNWTNSCSN
eukprot:TRINITY_DN685_c0_g2_i1.p1 TRINITY_DN685_c0_g2~~TRINITY_DN685_c0_g2_i1.p1  ORF type:complete len:193 (+),score=39.58 TRINITY_DN685_c0_g2_i1:51-581(+)